MQQTTNFQLPSWEASDRILRTDFNDMTEKLDTALGEHAAVLANVGNCQIYTTSYVGTGTCGQSNPTTLTFPAKPVLVRIASSDSRHYAVEFYGGAQVVMRDSDTAVFCIATWGETTLSWYHSTSSSGQLNEKNVTYQVMALIQKGA